MISMSCSHYFFIPLSSTHYLQLHQARRIFHLQMKVQLYAPLKGQFEALANHLCKYGYSASYLFINESGNNIQSKLLGQLATDQYRNLKCKLQKEAAKASLSTNSNIKYNSECLFFQRNYFSRHLIQKSSLSQLHIHFHGKDLASVVEDHEVQVGR